MTILRDRIQARPLGTPGRAVLLHLTHHHPRVLRVALPAAELPPKPAAEIEETHWRAGKDYTLRSAQIEAAKLNAAKDGTRWEVRPVPEKYWSRESEGGRFSVVGVRVKPPVSPPDPDLFIIVEPDPETPEWWRAADDPIITFPDESDAEAAAEALRGATGRPALAVRLPPGRYLDGRVESALEGLPPPATHPDGGKAAEGDKAHDPLTPEEADDQLSALAQIDRLEGQASAWQDPTGRATVAFLDGDRATRVRVGTETFGPFYGIARPLEIALDYVAQTLLLQRRSAADPDLRTGVLAAARSEALALGQAQADRHAARERESWELARLAKNRSPAQGPVPSGVQELLAQDIGALLALPRDEVRPLVVWDWQTRAPSIDLTRRYEATATIHEEDVRDAWTAGRRLMRWPLDLAFTAKLAVALRSAPVSLPPGTIVLFEVTDSGRFDDIRKGVIKELLGDLGYLVTTDGRERRVRRDDIRAVLGQDDEDDRAAAEAVPPLVTVPVLVAVTPGKDLGTFELEAPSEVVAAAGWQVLAVRKRYTLAVAPPGVVVPRKTVKWMEVLIDLEGGKAPDLEAFVTWADAVHRYFGAHPEALEMDAWGRGHYSGKPYRGHSFVYVHTAETSALHWTVPVPGAQLERSWPLTDPPRLAVRRIRYPGIEITR